MWLQIFCVRGLKKSKLMNALNLFYTETEYETILFLRRSNVDDMLLHRFKFNPDLLSFSDFFV